MKRITVISNIFVFLLITNSLLYAQQTGDNSPKNVIIFISDGCGYNHVDAVSMYQYGKSGVQVYEQFPVKYGMSHFPADGEKYNPDEAWKSFGYVLQKVTDSAASGTAIATGVKTYNGAIGVDVNKKPLENILERAERHGKATGVVSSVQFAHATPASFVAHNEKRNNIAEIAKEMILESTADVIMGCGNPRFNNDGKKLNRPKYFAYVGGMPVWESLLEGTAGNDADGDGKPDYWKLIQERSEFRDLMSGETPKRILGVPCIFNTLQRDRGGDRNANPYEVPLIETVPTLEEMTRAALNVLDEDPDGFFLMVEGGAIDWAAHHHEAGRMIEEEIFFNRAVESAVDWVEAYGGWKKTLIIVTGDHETGYLTGPGSGIDGAAVWNPLVNNGAGNVPGMEWHTGGHTNSLIPFFAKGAGSELFHECVKGTDLVYGKYIDNTDIGKMIMNFMK